MPTRATPSSRIVRRSAAARPGIDPAWARRRRSEARRHPRCRQLPLDGVAPPERHGDELADEPVAGIESIQPGLVGADHVVLLASVELAGPRLAGYRVDLAGGDLHRDGMPVPRAEVQPERLALVPGDEDTPVLSPVLGDGVEVALDTADREAAQTGRQRIGGAVVGDAQRALEADAEALADAELVVGGRDGEHGDLLSRNRCPRSRHGAPIPDASRTDA
jgi:hypothetical protein